LIYPLLNFTPSLKLIYSTNHFLLSLFHTLMSFLWLSWPGFQVSISHSFSLIHPQPFHSPAFRPILMYIVSGNKPPSINLLWLAFAGTLNLLTHFTNHFITCTQIVIVFIIHLIFMWGNYYYFFFSMKGQWSTMQSSSLLEKKCCLDLRCTPLFPQFLWVSSWWTYSILYTDLEKAIHRVPHRRIVA